MQAFEEILLAKAKEDYGSDMTLYKLFHGGNSPYTLHDIVVASAREFAKQACEEQKKICYDEAFENCPPSVHPTKMLLNAPLPELK